MEKYLIQLPSPPHFEVLTFAVDASWPTNCLEPYAIENFSQEDILYDTPGMTAELKVDVLDWQDDVQEVKSGTECGIAVKNYNDVQPGDQIEVFERIEVARTLD